LTGSMKLVGTSPFGQSLQAAMCALTRRSPTNVPLASETILHDPTGPDVKMVGESAWLVYPVKGILTMSAWMAFFLTFLNITQRRLQFLETLPEDYDASPPPSSQPPGPNDLIDLKLS